MTKKGKGWHGDSAGHARAAKKSGGSKKKKTTLSQASKALSKRGLTLSHGKTDLKKGVTSYRITSAKTGKSVRMSAKRIMRIM